MSEVEHTKGEVIPFERKMPSEKDLKAMDVSPNAVYLDDVQKMGNLVTAWHAGLVQDLHHKLQMPADVGIDIPTGTVDADGNDEVIDGNHDHRAGFLAGINYALERLDTFPIKGVPEDEPPEAA